MLELQRSPSSRVFHTVYPGSMVRVVQSFSEDMDLLERALPSNMAPTASEKIQFVLGKKTFRDIVQRLQERKSSVITLLGIIGR